MIDHEVAVIQFLNVRNSTRQVILSINKWRSKKYNKLVNITKRNRLTDIENKLVVTSGERGKEGGAI